MRLAGYHPLAGFLPPAFALAPLTDRSLAPLTGFCFPVGDLSPDGVDGDELPFLSSDFTLDTLLGPRGGDDSNPLS